MTTAYTDHTKTTPTAYLSVNIANSQYSPYPATNRQQPQYQMPIFSPCSASSTQTTLTDYSFPFSPCTPSSPSSEDDEDYRQHESENSSDEEDQQESKRIKSPGHSKRDTSGRKSSPSCKKPSGISKRVGKQKKEISKDEIKKYFNYSQSKAAKLLGISVSTLKRRFYSMNMGRWPYPENRNLARKRSISYVCSPNSRPEKQLDPHTLHALFRAFKSTKPEHNNILPTVVLPDNESQ